ncbi:MAG: aminodeoxychorismate synthase component I [Rhodococcus sp.]|uniref:aminodeoxychorismate synthase component I n=1 Tax=Rhodococcus TaxID=1827 RepID=UPI00168F4FB0|nr:MULTISPECIES: aminodeoxychorismate synthase component I [Rhodococcus]NLV78768.1 aminodeoxychorismate synthase component I [Rhodococcus sp. (in: high G+C Gram-positive bacteria)]
MPLPTRTLLVDNYDSFTYNLYSLLSSVNGIPPVVVPNDTGWEQMLTHGFDNVVISPGPGRPDRVRDFGISARALLDAGVPALGVCLGHQGLCQLFGSAVVPAPEPVHGRTSDIHHDGTGLFTGLASPFTAVRYHSLIADRVPDDLVGCAHTDDGLLMAVAHRTRPLWGVQFHPESIGTDLGADLLTNFRAATPTRTAVTVTAAPPPRPVPPTPFRYVLASRVLNCHPDPHAAYERLFAAGPHSFLLDGSCAHEPDSRFTVMGDASGPRAEFVTYSVAETTVREFRAGADPDVFHCTFFEHLDRRLAERRVAPRDDLPFAFGLGYVGYLGYELKADAGAQLVHTSPVADAAMVFADRAVVLDHDAGRCYLLALTDPTVDDADAGTAAWFDETAAALATLADDEPAPPPPPLTRTDGDTPIRLRHDPGRYLGLIGHCLAEIRSGETYEVCLTNTATVPRRIDPVRTYRQLRAISPTPYSALLKFPELSVLSASPERFLRIDRDGVVESKPIKGTRPRGGSDDEDRALREHLRISEKDRAENLMIVDLVRNDLSRVCIPGSVHVPKLFDVETYSAVHQLVSTVRGVLRPEVSPVDCVRAAFPGGSMTGAPKLRTMEIIDKLEDGPRGVYSGALGYFSLTGTVDLSIVIRTLVATDREVTFGIGGAIVALSDPGDELDETLVKAVAMRRCLTDPTVGIDSDGAAPGGAPVADGTRW